MQDNIAQILLNKDFLIESGHSYVLEPGTVTIRSGDTDIDITYDCDNKVTVITARQAGESRSIIMDDYPPEPTDDQIYGNDGCMKELERRSEESCRQAGR